MRTSGSRSRLFTQLLCLASALQACAAEPTSRTADSDASADATGETASSDAKTFEAEASVTCLSTHPSAVPVPSDGAEATCLFELVPPLPTGEYPMNVVTVDGVGLPATEFELHGNDVLELTGQACTDYRAGTITNVSLHVACSDA